MDTYLDMLEELFEKDKANINLQDAFRDYDEWDSLTLLGLGAMIHNEYGITIPRADFEKIKTVEELYNYILEHK
jgi:acyl carrier protein